MLFKKEERESPSESLDFGVESGKTLKNGQLYFQRIKSIQEYEELCGFDPIQ